MASIVKRGRSYSVVYMTTVDGQRKQKWETYHSLDEAERRKQILTLFCKITAEKSGKRIDTVRDLMDRYILLYGQMRWSFSTFQSNCGLIRNYILPLFGAIKLQELSPLAVAELYREFLGPPGSSSLHGKSIRPATLKSIHKLLHSAFEQAVLWEYIPCNPFKRAALPNVIPREQHFLLAEQIITYK